MRNNGESLGEVAGSNGNAAFFIIDEEAFFERLRAVVASEISRQLHLLVESMGESDSDAKIESLYTARDIATLLNSSVRSVERYMANGVLPAPVKIAGVNRWYASDVREWLADLRERQQTP